MNRDPSSKSGNAGVGGIDQSMKLRQVYGGRGRFDGSFLIAVESQLWSGRRIMTFLH